MASRIGRFFAELKRRKVRSATAAYVVVVAGAIGLADAALPAEVWEGFRIPVVVIALAGLPLAVALAWVLGGRREKARGAGEVAAPAAEEPAPVRRKGVVVLPFDNISPDSGDTYFSEGLTAEIITALSRLRALRVISRSSAVVLKGMRKDVRTIGQDLKVGYVLEGSVRRAGNQLRISAQLVDTEDEAHVWAEQYDGVLDDVFGMQERVARSIVGALDLTLTPGESEGLEVRPAGTFRAYDCFLKGRHEVYRFTRESLESGIQTLRQGLDLFPDDPLLLATLGEAYFIRYDWGMVREEWVLNRSEELARKALSADPGSALGRKLLGHVERYRGRVDRACEHFLEAYRADPTDTGIMLHTAMALAEVGWPDQAAAVYAKLLSADPLTPFNYLMAGLGEILRGKPDSGLRLIRAFRSRAATVPGHMSGFLAVALFLAGRGEEALREIDRALSGDPDPHHDWLLTFLRHACKGEGEAALGILDEERRAVAWDDADLPLVLSAFFAHLGMADEALVWMGRALERGLVNYPFFAVVGPFDGLRSDERFQRLLAAMKEARDRSGIPGMLR